MHSSTGGAELGAELDVCVQERRAHTVVHLAGEIDLSTMDQLHECLGLLYGDVTVDLGRVTFMGSMGISTLTGAMRRLAEEGSELHLRNPQPAIRRVFALLGLSDLIDE
jgi:anti-sigma B factor antagonist